MVLVSQDETLDKAGVRYVESKLVTRALQDKQATILNGNSPSEKRLSEADTAVMNVFIEDIVYLLSVLGYKVIRSHYDLAATDRSPKLHLESTGQTATGRQTDEGFEVYEGSTARGETTDSVAKNTLQLRKQLQDMGVLRAANDHDDTMLFTQTYLFSSPSLAASVILGRSSNGRTEWKTKEGVTLKELEE